MAARELERVVYPLYAIPTAGMIPQPCLVSNRGRLNGARTYKRLSIPAQKVCQSGRKPPRPATPLLEDP